jgi:phosphoribosylformimino-5-aminoimidazole carboxamide ribotide isomerase
MQILPVLDLQNGLVVRGVAGRRHEYRPVVSTLTRSALPLDVARAFREHFNLTDLYVADLDALAGAPPALVIFEALLVNDFRLLVDAGIRHAADARPLTVAGIQGIIAGLETLAGPEVLRRLCAEIGPERVVFSLDLRGGQPLAPVSAWAGQDAWTIAREAGASGIRRLLVLDVARVGVSAGTGTEELCARLAAAEPPVEILAGGGVRDLADLRRLQQCGVNGVLVASALHDGRLRREDLRAL